MLNSNLTTNSTTGTASENAGAEVVNACVEGGGVCSTVVEGYNVQFGE